MAAKIYRLLVLLAIPALAWSSFAQQSKPTIRHHRIAEVVPDDSSSPEVDQAEAAMQKNDFATAETLLQKAVVAKPQDYRAWFDLGYLYNATKRDPQAVEAYQKAVTAKPDVFESNLNLGILLARQGNNAEAAQYLKAATALKPSANPDEGLFRAWQSLGRVEEDSDPRQALAAYAEAESFSPKDPEPHISAAILLEKQNNLDAAAKEFQTAADLDPKSKDAYAGLANVATRQKKFPEAEAALRKVLALDPQDSNAKVQLGRLLANDGKTDEAAQLLSSQANGKGDPHAALELGTLLVKAGKDAEAEQQLRVAAKGLPRDPEAHMALGSLLMHEKKYPEAQQELLLAVKLKPDLAEAYGNLAVVAAANKNYDLALRALEVRGKYLPESAATYFLRATCFDNLKAVKQAVEAYKQFLQADEGKMADQEWQARHRLVALDPRHADDYLKKK